MYTNVYYHHWFNIVHWNHWFLEDQLCQLIFNGVSKLLDICKRSVHNSYILRQKSAFPIAAQDSTMEITGTSIMLNSFPASGIEEPSRSAPLLIAVP
uniref:Uncharacterized protein n=1 Tax=Strigamia maritima TaxID=126957 RepID=T1JNA7_STRMM